MEGHEPKRPAADTATAENLKHLARLIDQGVPLNLKINGRRVALPADASFAIDLERDPRSGCVKVDIRWNAQFDSEEGPSNAGDSARLSTNQEELGRHLNDRKTSRPAPGNGGPHIRLKALITAPKI